MAAVTDDGSRAMARQVEAAAETGALGGASDILETLKVQETARIVRENRFKRVALQVPDQLVPYAWQLVHGVKAALGSDAQDVSVFVLGDTSYGSCCVDEVAADHHNADFIVHYGQSCLSQTSRLPTQLVFGNLALDAGGAAAALAEAIDTEVVRHVVVLRDVRFDYCAQSVGDALASLLKSTGCTVSVPALRSGFQPAGPGGDPPICWPSPAEAEAQDAGAEERREAQTAIVFLGSDPSQVSRTVLEAAAHKRAARVLALDPLTLRVEDAAAKGSSMLTKRFVKIQQAQDASVFGILVGTMGVQGYGEVLAHVSRLIRDAGRKSYTFLMGKINPQKLANFTNIDAYVIVACPLNSLIDSKEFYKPVVTPLEVEIALGLREWSAAYTTTFDHLLVGQSVEQGAASDGSDSDAPHFSAVTGQLVSPRVLDRPGALHDGSAGSTSGHVTVRYASPAGDALQELTFRGLDPSKGDKPAAAAVPGQTGVAAALYEIAPPPEPQARSQAGSALAAVDLRRAPDRRGPGR